MYSRELLVHHPLGRKWFQNPVSISFQNLVPVYLKRSLWIFQNMHVSYLAECMKEVANRKKISISFEARDHFSKLTDEWLNISAQLLLYCFSKLRNDQCPVPKGQLRQFSSNKEQDQNFCIYFNKVSPWQFHSTQTLMLYFG